MIKLVKASTVFQDCRKKFVQVVGSALGKISAGRSYATGSTSDEAVDQDPDVDNEGPIQVEVADTTLASEGSQHDFFAKFETASDFGSALQSFLKPLLARRKLTPNAPEKAVLGRLYQVKRIADLRSLLLPQYLLQMIGTPQGYVKCIKEKPVVVSRLLNDAGEKFFPTPNEKPRYQSLCSTRMSIIFVEWLTANPLKHADCIHLLKRLKQEKFNQHDHAHRITAKGKCFLNYFTAGSNSLLIRL